MHAATLALLPLAIQTSTLILAIAPLAILQFALMIIGYVDLARRPRVTGGHKWVWAVVMLLSLIGPILYLVVGRQEE